MRRLIAPKSLALLVLYVCGSLGIELYPYGIQNRDSYLAGQNDAFSNAIELRFGMPFYDKKYWRLYVNENGLISFENPVNEFLETTPNFPLGPMENGEQRILIAPFWANIDLDNQGYVYFRQSTEPDLLERAAEEVHIAFVERMDFVPKMLLIATWVECGFYGEAGSNNPQNTFQVVLATNEIETFALFLYDRIEWTTGTESGGDRFTGRGGTPAQVGFNAGDGFQFYWQMYSRNGANLLRLPTESNIDIVGEWVYQVDRRDGVEIGGCTGAGNVKTYPRYDTMLGHSWVYIGGPCFQGDDDIWLRYGTEENQLALTNCTYLSAQRAFCVTPTFYQVGRVPISLTRNWGYSYPYSGTFDIIEIDTLPPRTHRMNPDSEAWLRADLPVVIEWDPKLINNSEVRIDILVYEEYNGIPLWKEIEEIDFVAPNNGRYEFIPRGDYQVNEKNGVGVIRVTRRFKRDEIALWSDVHILGYLMNSFYQEAPSVWSNQRCVEWYEQQQSEPVYDFEQDLNPCPCNLSQAVADRGRWEPLRNCDMTTAGTKDRNDYCKYKDDIQHCVINIVQSPQGADSVCCYDFEENLVYAGDSWEGSFHHRVSVNGIPPFAAPRRVPLMSSWISDGIPYFTCCIWGERCELYQEYRQTRDCRDYEPPRVATIFGDPHIISFDGLEFTLNGKGEYTLMKTINAQTLFTLQGRTEQVIDYEGNNMQATILTSIAMKEQDLEIVRVLKSERTVLEVMYGAEILDIDQQQKLQFEGGIFLTFPRVYEDGNITQVIITFQDSEIGIVVNGTADNMIVKVFIPEEFEGQVEGLLGNWNGDPLDDLRTAGGSTIDPNSSPAQIYELFGKSWEIDPDETLLYYDQGRDHEFFQDNNFVPLFTAPPGNLPPDITAQDVDRVCAGNQFCEYDVRTTGKLDLGRSTMQAYNDYWFAHKNLVKLVTCKYYPTPKNGSKLFYREHNHNVGSEIEFGCDDDFVLAGSSYRVCQPTGEWTGDYVENTCIESLICGGLETPDHSGIDVVRPYSPEDMRVRYSCDEGYEIFGPQERRCDVEYEKWRPLRDPGCYRNLSPVEITMTILGAAIGVVIIIALVGLVLFSASKKDRKKAEEKNDAMFGDIQIGSDGSTNPGGDFSKAPPPGQDFSPHGKHHTPAVPFYGQRPPRHQEYRDDRAYESSLGRGTPSPQPHVSLLDDSKSESKGPSNYAESWA